jgi:hypothetical protein
MKSGINLTINTKTRNWERAAQALAPREHEKLIFFFRAFVVINFLIPDLTMLETGPLF